MSNMKKEAYSVEVIGFNQTERIVLSSIFGLSARRSPKFLQHHTIAYSPDIFLIDAADSSAVELYRERNALGKVPAIMIGDTNHGTGWPVLPRPLQWTRMFKAFDLAIEPMIGTPPPAPPPNPNAGAMPAPYTAPAATAAMPIDHWPAASIPPAAAPLPAAASAAAVAAAAASAAAAALIQNAESAQYPGTQPMIKIAPVPQYDDRTLPADRTVPYDRNSDFERTVPTPIAPASLLERAGVKMGTQPQQMVVPMVPTARDDITMNVSPPTRPSSPAAPVAPAPADWVLVVDDNQTVREFMKSKLTPFGFNVDYAETGEQAVGFTGQKHYACVFLDVIMPGIDGYQVCKLIKSKKSIIGKTAVVMLTSKGSPFDKIRGAMAGCDAYLTKPVNEEKLLETIVKFIPTHA